MFYGSQTYGQTTYGGKRNHSAGLTNADTILRKGALDRSYKLEIAWGGNLTRLVNSSGTNLCVITSVDAQDSSYPASNIINGINCHYNPLVDLDNNWWGATSSPIPNNVVVDLGQSSTFNEIVIYFHPLQPTCTNVTLATSPDNVTYTNLFTGNVAGNKLILNFNSITNRYIKLTCNNTGSDGNIRVVQLEVYNWIDETLNMNRPNGIPSINLSAKSDSNQNALPTPSELSFSLQNYSQRFSAFNSSSPIYGIAQPDGNGSGVRAGSLVRLTGTATDVNKNTFSQVIFKGVIGADDNPAGSTGIAYDDDNQTVLFVCKSIYTKLNQTINTPAYDGADFTFIIQDVCRRCGIADQDTSIQGINQGVPYLGFTNQTGISILNSLAGALPFFRVNETHNPNYSLNFNNYGRSRRDIDTTTRLTAATSVQEIVINTVTKKMYFFGPAQIDVWDMTQPFGSGVTGNIGSTGTDVVFAFIYQTGNQIFFLQSNLILKSINMSTNAVTTVGTFSGTTFRAACGFGQYIYVVTTSGGADTLYVYDATTFPTFSPTSKGGLPTTIQLSPNAIGADGTYLIYQRGSITFSIWKHNGTPLTTPFAHTDFSYFTSTVIAGEDYTNLACFYSTGQKMVGVVSILHSGDTLRRQEIWSLDIPTVFNTPSTTATKQGVVVDNTSAKILNNNTACVSMIGTYLYFSDNESNLWVWDTSKAFSYLFYLGFGNQANQQPVAPSKQTIMAGSGFCGSLGPIMNGADWSNNNWFSIFTSGIANTGLVVAYTVQNVKAFPSTGQVSFDLNDGTTVNMVTIYGNPVCNRIQLASNLFTAAGSTSTLWSVSSQGIFFPSNKKTTVPVQLSGLSIRGYNKSITTQRYITIGATNVFDDPTTTTNVTINAVVYAVTFFAYGGIGFITIDTTNKAAVSLTPSGTNAVITGKAITQPQNTVPTVDQIDNGSFAMFKKYFVKNISSPAFNDPSFYKDFLYQGRYNQVYMQPMTLFWYPIVSLSEAININNTLESISNGLFEVVSYEIHGWNTIIMLKQFLSSFVI